MSSFTIFRMGDSLYERLSDAVTELAGLLAELELILPHKPRQAGKPSGASGRTGKPGATMTSWHPLAASVILDVHYGARELEQNLKYATAGVLRTRGGSTQNTTAALMALPSLAAAGGDWPLKDTTRTVERWCWRARVALGELEPWAHVPRQPGQPSAKCPFCGCRSTLRMKAWSGLLRCVNPGCLDAEGQRPVGRVEFGPVHGEPIVVWGDQTMGLTIVNDQPVLAGSGEVVDSA